MIVIDQRPYEVNWSRNQIRYVLRTDTDTATEGLAFEIRLYFKRFGSPAFEQVFSQPAYTDSNGVVTFYPKAILDAMLQYELPTLSLTAPGAMYSQVGLFYIDFREITAENPNPEWSSDADNTRYVLKGGIAEERWQDANYFVTYFQVNKPFLTWQLSGRLCGQTERMYLFFLMPRAANGAVTVKVKVVYTDNSVNTTLSMQLPDVPVKYALYSIPTGVQQLALKTLVPDKRIYYYEVSVEDAGGVLVTPFRYVVDYRNSYNIAQFNYVNSLGGIDSARILGDTEPTITREMDTAEITAGYNNSANQVGLHQFMAAITGTKEFKGNIGFVGKKEQEYLAELFFTRSCWEERFNRWWPVIITSKELPLAKPSDDLFSVPVEWTYAVRNTQFTPDFAPLPTFGACPVVLNPQATLGTDEDPDLLTWIGNAAHVSYVVHLYLRLTANGPVAQSYINVAATSAEIPQGVESWAYIKANCQFDESPYIGPIHIRQ